MRVARSTKSSFSNNFRDMQLANPDLHYLNYRLLDRFLSVGASGTPPVDTVNFVEAVSAEICLVNTCFERKSLELLQSIAGLRHMLEGRNPEEAIELISEERNSVDGLNGSGQFWQRGCGSLVEVLDGLTRLREYAVWNCFAVARIHRRWSKQVPADVQDKNIQAVIQHLQASGPMEWLRQLRFYDGLEFAELYIAIETLNETRLLAPCSRQGSPDRPTPKCRASLEEDALVHSLASSGSDWLLVDSVIDSSDPAPSTEPQLPVAPKEVVTSLLSSSHMESSSSMSLEVPLRCIACLTALMSHDVPAKIQIQSSPEAALHEAEASTTTQFACGHRLCRSCFGLGRNVEPFGASGTANRSDARAECGICRKSSAFTAKDSDGTRSFRGILAQFQHNLFMAEENKLCKAEPKVGVLDPTTAALAKHVSSHCEMSNI